MVPKALISPSLDKSISPHFSLSLSAASPARMSRCLLELMWLKYPSGFSLRSGTQPLDPLQFSFLDPEIGCCQVNFASPSHSSYFPKSPLTGKERLGEERQKGESRPRLPLSLCNFRLLLSSLRSFCQCTVMCYIPSCLHFPAQCVELSSSFWEFPLPSIRN